MKEVPMQMVSDERYGLDEQAKGDATGETNIATANTA